MDFSVDLDIIYKSVEGISHYESVTHHRMTPGSTRALRDVHEERAEGPTSAGPVDPRFIINTHLCLPIAAM
jgi:hypothetical protein